MGDYKNIKVEINKEQPLDEVVYEQPTLHKYVVAVSGTFARRKL